MKKFILSLAIATVAVVACQKTENVNLPIEEPMPVNLNIGANTKATDTEFENGDAVGIYMINATDSLYKNNKTTKSATAWTAAQSMWWPDKETKANFYCYYPYSESAIFAAHPFNLKADQSSEANYRASDFVWGKKENVDPTTETINITTAHIMSNMTIYLAAGDGFTSETLAAATVSVKIKGLKTASSINLKTGAVTATGTASDVTPYKADGYYKAIIVPQSVTATNDLIVVTVNGVDYGYKKAVTFNSGKRSKFTITINKSNSGINIGIDDWDDEESDYGGDAE